MIPHSVVLYAIALSLFCLFRSTQGRPASGSADSLGFISDSDQKYLATFGYLPKSDLEVGNLRSGDELQKAIRRLQRFAGLRETGQIDDETRKLMESPRCGLPDPDISYARRTKRFALQGQKWPYTNLTWTITNYTRDLPQHLVKEQLDLALKIWARDSKLSFSFLRSDTIKDLENGVDIVVAFDKGYHGDGYPFDGEGKILAHAFFPGTGRGGDAHFDDEEIWRKDVTDLGSGGMSLFSVAAHEFGHSLGLSHSSVSTALMYPWYKSFSQNMSLPADDKHGIQQLYGRIPGRDEYGKLPDFAVGDQPPRTPAVTQAPPRRPEEREREGDSGNEVDSPLPTLSPGKPDLCNTEYDAVAVIREELFVFKGPYFWRKGKNGLYSSSATEISRFWYGLPQNVTHIDAIYERLDQKIVIFIGRQFWVFEGNTKAKGYPKDIYELWLPKNIERIDAAMVWGWNSKTYLFSGTMYWRFDEDVGHVELDYPRDMSTWDGVPYNIDAATQWLDGTTYFFKGKVYYEFDDLRFRVSDGPSLSAPFWLNCPASHSSGKGKLSSVPHSMDSDDLNEWNSASRYNKPGSGNSAASFHQFPSTLVLFLTVFLVSSA